MDGNKRKGEQDPLIPMIGLIRLALILAIVLAFRTYW